MKWSNWIWMAAAGMVMFTACGKEEDPNNVNNVDISGKNNQEVMMIQPWSYYSYTQTTNNNTVDAMDACQKDEVFVFKANGICEVRTNAEKCYDGEPATYETMWSMPSPTGNVVNFFGFDFTIKSKTNTSVSLERLWEDRTGEWVTEKLELRASK